MSRDHLITCAAYTDTAKPCDGGCALLPGARHPCDYCGTMLDEDDCVESDIPAVNGPMLHTASQCREYVHAALRSYKRELGAARVSLEDNRVLVQELAKWILDRPRSTDHACSRCIPGGEIVVPGFVCAWHIAEGLRAAATGGS